MGLVIGYLRLTGDDLDPVREHMLAQVGDLDRIYQDEVGHDQPALAAATDSMKFGDCLMLAQLSQLRLGVGGFLRFVERDIRGRGLHLCSQQECIDTRTVARGWDFFAMVEALREMEKQLAAEKADTQLLTIGRPRGRNGGRPRKLNDRQVEEVRQEYYRRGGKTTMAKLASEFGVCKQTLYNRVIHSSDPGIFTDF